MLACSKNLSLISIHDLTKEEIMDLLSVAASIQDPSLLKGSILASCFFEASTRTRLSFETAMLRLGGSVIGFSDANGTSQQKGESLSDTIKMMSLYADVIVIRHPLEGAAALAAEASDKPVINAGDGSNQHPSQTLLDLYTIKECQGSLEGLNIALAGDLKYGRTIHSLTQALTHFKPRLYLVSPPELEMPKEITDELKSKGIKYSLHKTLQEVIPKCDILYMTRLQKERYSVDLPKRNYSLTADMLEHAKPNLKILHPLPRVDEIEKMVDKTPHAHYFEQAGNGLKVRQALLARALGK